MQLTDLQRSVWQYVAARLDEGVAPTLDEIARASRLGSAPAARAVVIALERKGYLRRVPHQQRSIRLLRWPSGHESTPDVFPLPVRGVIAAGQPMEVFEPHDEVEWIAAGFARSPEDYVLRVKGNSMVGEGILDGDLVVVQPAEHAENGETVVAMLADGSVTLKKVYFERDHVRLQPANPQLEAMVVPSVRVQGKVVAVLRRLGR